MNYEHLIQELRREREKLDEAILAIEQLVDGRNGRPADSQPAKKRGRPLGSKNRITGRKKPETRSVNSEAGIMASARTSAD
jgi:hypothetical protein